MAEQKTYGFTVQTTTTTGPDVAGQLFTIRKNVGGTTYMADAGTGDWTHGCLVDNVPMQVRVSANLNELEFISTGGGTSTLGWVRLK